MGVLGQFLEISELVTFPTLNQRWTGRGPWCIYSLSNGPCPRFCDTRITQPLAHTWANPCRSLSNFALIIPKVGRPRTTTKIKISYDDGGKKKGKHQESRTVQTADSAEPATAAAANRSLEETWRRRESIIVLQIWPKCRGGHATLSRFFLTFLYFGSMDQRARLRDLDDVRQPQTSITYVTATLWPLNATS